MGDVGSLALGGAMGVVAVLIKQEVLLRLHRRRLRRRGAVRHPPGGQLQAARGKRIFKMAPIHHHFEAMGWPESKIIVALLDRRPGDGPVRSHHLETTLMNFEGKLVVVVGLGKVRFGRRRPVARAKAHASALWTKAARRAANAEANSLPSASNSNFKAKPFSKAPTFIVVSPDVPLDLPVFDAAKQKSIPIIGEVELAGYYPKGRHHRHHRFERKNHHHRAHRPHPPRGRRRLPGGRQHRHSSHRHDRILARGPLERAGAVQLPA